MLKGPASVLYGRADPGGLINIITKQPLDTPRYVIEQQAGSFNFYRTQWDISQPVESMPGLAYRFSGAYQTEGSFRAFQGGRHILLAPVVSYRPSNWTEFTVDTQFLAQTQQSDTGFPVVAAGPAAIPLSRSFQEPNDPKDKLRNLNIGYTFKQNLTEDWKVVNRFLSTTPALKKPNIVGFCADLTFCVDADGQTLLRSTQFQSLAGDTYSTNLDLDGKFDAIGGKHAFLMGLDYLNSYYDYYLASGAGVYPINMYAPVYGTVPLPAYWDAIAGSAFKLHNSVLTRQKGFYVQDHVTWFDKLHILVGARYDVADVTIGSSTGDFACADPSDPSTCTIPLYNATKSLAIANRLASPTALDTAWSPRAGAVYDILPQLNVYGSYSQSFGVNNGFSASNESFPPERGKQWEVGLKSEPLPGSPELSPSFRSPSPAFSRGTSHRRTSLRKNQLACNGVGALNSTLRAASASAVR